MGSQQQGYSRKTDLPCILDEALFSQKVQSPSSMQTKENTENWKINTKGWPYYSYAAWSNTFKTIIMGHRPNSMA
jgi:hypothetical protein